MYEFDRYIMLIRSTNFNPFRLAAAYALCSPPSPASGDGFHKVPAPRARDKISRANASPKQPSLLSRAVHGGEYHLSVAQILLERVASTKHVSAAASRVSQKFVSDGQALFVPFLP